MVHRTVCQPLAQADGCMWQWPCHGSGAPLHMRVRDLHGRAHTTHSVRSPLPRKKHLRGGSCSCLEGSQPATQNKFLLRPHCFPCPATYAGGTPAMHGPMGFPTPHTSSFWDQELCLRGSEQQRAFVETPKALWEPCHWALLSLELQFDTRNCPSL